jgi:hypothetical protein
MRFAKYALLTVFLALVSFAQVISPQIDFPPDDFRIESDRYVRIYHEDGVPFGNPGEPQWVMVSRHVLLPPGSAMSHVSITDEVWEPFAVGVPFPAQPPAILSIGDPSTVAPDPDAFSRDEWFPQSPLISYSQGNMSGYSVVGVCVAPVRWNPVAGIAERLANCRLNVEYVEGHEAPLAPARRSMRGADFWNRAINDIVLNPEITAQYAIPIDPDAYDWAIFLPSGLPPDLTQLLWLRRSYGLRDTVVQLADVYSSFSGIDNAEKLRHAIRDLYLIHGITYATIVGDPMITPYRYVFAFDCEAGFYVDENQIPSDLYFSDLDGNWNADGDTIWGEIADSVDMYPDVLIGRYSLFPASHLAGFIDKMATYETFPSESFAKSGLMLGQVLWDDPYTDGAIFKDELIENVFPDNYDFGTVYGSHGGDADMAVESLGTGPNMINHAGHASYSVMCIGHGSCIWFSRMDELRNASRPGIFASIGCWPAAFDKESIAERYLNNALGGGIGFIGNSRYGWGSPGNPGFGYSEILDRAYFRFLFEGYPMLGEALAMTKIAYIPYARWENVWRWVIMELNLLGDPATEAIIGWDEISMSLETEGENIGVLVNDGSEPLGGISISAFDAEGLFDRAWTNTSGFANITLSGATAPVYITARRKGLAIAVDTLTTIGSGWFRVSFANEYGFSDGTADPGDTVKAVFSFGGFDSYISGLSWNPVSNFGAPILHSPSPSDLNIADSTQIWATFIIPSDVVPNANLTIDPQIVHSSSSIGYPVSLMLNIADFAILGAVLVDNDSSLESGETGRLWINLLNIGDGSKGAQNLELQCPGGELNLPGSPAIIPAGAPNDTLVVGPFDVEWSAGAEIKPVVEMRAIIGEHEHIFHVSTRKLGFEHDVESGESPFNRTPGTNRWRRTSIRAHSGSNSWWCGDPFLGRYLSNMEDTLYSDLFVIGADAELAFFAYMNFPTYGSDGLSVEIVGSNDTIRVDYLGSGGALLSFIVGWAEYRYSLGNTPFQPGDTIRVRFRFSSDSEDEEQGVFIDDIRLICESTEFSTSVGVSPELPEKIALEVFPNPFNSALNIRLSGAVSDKARLAIFDIAGRLVRELPPTSGGIIWQGTDKQGNIAPSGIYFIRLIDNEKVFTVRAVLLK